MTKDNSITLADLSLIWDKFKYAYFVRSILALKIQFKSEKGSTKKKRV